MKEVANLQEFNNNLIKIVVNHNNNKTNKGNNKTTLKIDNSKIPLKISKKTLNGQITHFLASIINR